MVEKITKIQGLNELILCTNNHTFIASSVKLIPFTSDTDMNENIWVNQSYEILTGKTEEPVFGFLLACPVCGLVHLSGFSLAENTQVTHKQNEDDSLLRRALIIEA